MTVLLLVFLRVRSHGSSKKNIWNSDLIFEHVDASTCNSNYKPLTSYSQAGALQFVLCELLMLSLLDTIPYQYLISLLVFADYAVYIDCMDTIVFTCTFPGSSCFSWNKDLYYLLDLSGFISLFVGCYLELNSSGTITWDIDTNPYPAQIWTDLIQ